MDDTQTPKAEGAAERRARAAALQAGVMARMNARPHPTPEQRGETLVPDLDPGPRETLAGLSLHGRRYGISHVNRAKLRKMGCRTLADAAALPYGRLCDWLGYQEADLVRDRLAAIAGEARSGLPEPGVSRMAGPLDAEARDWLAARPVEDLAGRGVAAAVPAALREAGHASLLAVATEECDAIEDIHGIGLATVGALRARLAGILAEGLESPARKRRRNRAVEDAEWDAAAPD